MSTNLPENHTNQELHSSVIHFLGKVAEISSLFILHFFSLILKGKNFIQH